MPYGSAVGKQGSSGEFISHFTGVRMRINGSGNLQMRLLSFQDVSEQVLVPFVMQTTTKVEPFRLANFNEQRASLEGKTTEIDEYFKINRIILFAKPLWTDYPASMNGL